MRSKTLGLFLALAVLMTAGALYADDAEQIHFQGKMYSELSTDIDDEGARETNFSVTRVYMTMKKKLGNGWSVRFTTDIGTEDGEPYDVYAKYAYIQKKMDLGVVSLKAQYGLIGTPNIGKTDKMMDLRWIYNDYSLDKAKEFLGGHSLDNSADMGASVSAKIMKKVEVIGAVTNGEGYKDTKPNYDGKAYYGTLQINPFADLYVNGYYRTEKSAASRTESYFGGGLGWKAKNMMIGGNYIMAKDENGSVEDEYTTMEFWAHLKMQEFIGMPLIIAARYGAGSADKEAAGADSDTSVIGVGVGYQFTKSFRAIAWFENAEYDPEVGDSTKEQVFYLKSEAKF